MTRREMIELLVEDRIWEWIYARCDEGLRDMLLTGFIGFEKYTDKELKDAIADFDDKTIKELREMVKEYKEADSKEKSFPF